MTREIKQKQQISADINERAMPPSQAPGTQSIAHDMKITRLKTPDASGCNWDATFTFGPKSLSAAVSAAKALYNLPSKPAPAGRVVRSAIRGKPVQF